MKPENIKKVWEYYRGYQIRYRLGRSKYIVEAFNKNMNGDFSPSQFYNPIESRVHLIVQEYIKYLLEQETLEQAQQEQTIVDTQLKAPKETNNRTQTTTPIEKTHNSPSSQGGVRRSREGDKETHPQTQQPKSHKAHRAKAPALKFTKEILGEVSRSDGGVKNRSAIEGIKMKPVREKLSLFKRGTRCLHRRGISILFCLKNSPPIPRKGGVARSDEVVKVHDCEPPPTRSFHQRAILSKFREHNDINFQKDKKYNYQLSIFNSQFHSVHSVILSKKISVFQRFQRELFNYQLSTSLQ